VEFIIARNMPSVMRWGSNHNSSKAAVAVAGCLTELTDFLGYFNNLLTPFPFQ
jgi:hypothetical protein